MFNGWYDNYARPAELATGGDSLMMKWNDAWLSNMDCGTDGINGAAPDGLLDRHYGYASYQGSGAWLTNHMSGTYELGGETCKWEYFVKIVAAPTDAILSGDIWTTADGTEIGPAIWGDFAVVQELYNDPCTGDHGLLYKSPLAPGFGIYKP